ncbi:MAG: hypothetical protein E7012_01630 [Alphaproteobacteria bacterium]|nr:hypothetical protein [Alphaproteobacteria bacterium]
MIKINDINKTKDISGAKASKKLSGSSNFADFLNVDIARNKQISGTTNISVADAIFATQMVDGEEEREIKKKLIKRGNNLIEKLEEIRDALLVGYIEKEKLIDIARLINEHKVESSDPKLQEIMAEIELRVEVELAKLTR